MKSTFFSVLLLGAVTVTAGTACAQGAKEALIPVSIRFGYIATGNDTMWVYGRDLGYFRDEGLKVEFREGKGSAATSQTVAAGSDDFGIDIDGGTFITLAAKGLAATAIMAPVAKSPMVILSPSKAPLKKPSDMVGKQIAIAAGSGAATLMPVLLKKNNVPLDKVSLVNMQSSPLLTTLLTGRVNGVATNIVVQATLKAKGLDTYAMRYADFGLNMPGQYLITSNAYLRAHADVVPRLIRALQNSMQATLTNPEAAAAAFRKAYPSYNADTALAETKIISSLFRSKSTEGKPLGTVSLEDARAGAKSLAEADQVPADFDVGKVVTNRYVTAK
jgi:NitT/TauT family transport system substrate-binding protein